MDKISVIVPIYNVEEYLGECIESIALQRLSCEMEVILIDDGSTDKSAIIAKEYAQGHNNIFMYSYENQGVSAARNKGLAKAKGNYIFFMDSDDILESGYIEKLYMAAKNTDADIVYAGFQIFEGNDKRTVERKVLYEPKTVTGNDWINMRINLGDSNNEIWCGLYKKSFFCDNKIIFREDLELYEDIYFSYFDVLKAKKVTTVSEYGYLYRMREKSLSHNGVPGERDMKACMSILESFILEYNSLNEQEKKTLGRACYEIISMMLYYLGVSEMDCSKQYYQAIKDKKVMDVLKHSISCPKEFVKYIIFKYKTDLFYKITKK